MNIFLKIFYYSWFGLIIVLNIIAIIGMYISTQSIYETWIWLQNTYSPFNVWNAMLNILLLMPGIGAYVWREKRLESGKQ